MILEWLVTSWWISCYYIMNPPGPSWTPNAKWTLNGPYTYKPMSNWQNEKTINFQKWLNNRIFKQNREQFLFKNLRHSVKFQ